MVTSSWDIEIAGVSKGPGRRKLQFEIPTGCVSFLKFSELLFCWNFKGERHLLMNFLWETL